MREVNLLFEFEHDGGLEETAHTLEERIGRLQPVEEVGAAPSGEMRLSGMEIAAAISVTIIVARSSKDLVQELRGLVQEISGLITDLRELKRVYVDVGDERISLYDLQEEHYRQLAQ